VTASPTTILVIIPSLEVGGAENDLLRILPRLGGRFRPVVWTFRTPGRLAPLLADRGIEVMEPPAINGWLPGWMTAEPSSNTRLSALRGIVRAGWRVLAPTYYGYKMMRRRKFDIIHAVLPNAYMVSVLANALSSRRPLIMSRTSQNYYHGEHRLFSLIERHILHRGIDLAVGNCISILDDLRAEGIAGERLCLVRNGIDLVSFDAEMEDRSLARASLLISAEALVLTIVANLHPYKGHADLVAALAHAAPQLPLGWQLLVIGSEVGDGLSTLKQLVVDLRLQDNVRFLGQRLDVPMILSAADIHVSASHTEGLPNNILEAMCARLPVVATDVGGVCELVVDGSTGILVPPRNPNSLSEAIRSLASDPRRRAILGNNGRQKVEAEFTIERSVKTFEEIYDSLAASHRNAK
jgi:glycosyltransferase involved in cell wall biosynthesis